MESFFRRRFFVFHLLCLTAAAFLCARAVNVVVDHQLLKLVSLESKPAATKPRPPPAPATRDFAAASEENIFEGRRETVVENGAAPADVKPTEPTGSWESAVLTALKLRLVGTAVFSEEEFSIASIVDESKGASTSASMFSINECVSVPTDPNDPNSKLVGKAAPCNRLAEAAIIKRIEPEKVYFWNETEGRYEYISIDEKPVGGKAPVVAKKGDEPAGDADLGKDIKKTGENTYEVGQGEVDKALNNLASLATEARIVPAFEGGKSVGFKLFSIRPGSLYSKIGLQNGDVINRINGYEITSPDKALEVYGKLKDSKHVTVDVKRRGKPTTLDYSITP
jgi:general secretion pathway protein C